MKILKTMILVLLVCSCNSGVDGKIASKSSKGVLKFDESSKDYNVKIYNEKGNVLKQFVFEDEFKDSSLDPFAISPENILLVFKCLGDDEKNYHVLINESKGTVGYIPKSDRHFIFETWERHILTVATVGFDPQGNPLKKSCGASADQVAMKGIEFFHPVEVKGDCLRVKWDDPQEGTGWIKWKDSAGNLTIELYYSM